MARIGVVVMECDGGALAAGFADRLPKRFALEQIKIERGWKHENLACGAAVECGGQRIDGSQLDLGSKTEYRLAGRGYSAQVSAIRIRDEEENRNQCSLPPMRPCLTIVASTSTMARTATSAVMSEIS